MLDARFHGPTERYTMLNGSVVVRFAEQRMTLSVKFVNLGNADAQQHIFGDILKRPVLGELKFNFESNLSAAAINHRQDGAEFTFGRRGGTAAPKPRRGRL